MMHSNNIKQKRAISSTKTGIKELCNKYTEGNIVVSNSTIANNEGTSAGGIRTTAYTRLTNTTISGNKATDVNGNGGGISSTDNLNLHNSTITNNEAGNAGGGIYTTHTTIRFEIRSSRSSVGWITKMPRRTRPRSFSGSCSRPATCGTHLTWTIGW